MIRFVMALCLTLTMCSLAEARPRLFNRNGGGGGTSLGALIEGESNSTAQGVANIMARQGRVGHCGGNSGYEGCGMAGTKDGAYNICCYANSGMKTVDVGYAQGANGMWFCCRRYVP